MNNNESPRSTGKVLKDRVVVWSKMRSRYRHSYEPQDATSVSVIFCLHGKSEEAHVHMTLWKMSSYVQAFSSKPTDVTSATIQPLTQLIWWITILVVAGISMQLWQGLGILVKTTRWQQFNCHCWVWKTLILEEAPTSATDEAGLRKLWWIMCIVWDPRNPQQIGVNGRFWRPPQECLSRPPQECTYTQIQRYWKST